ncbi:hypothetical protein NQZ68_026690 [Dissostichus eleginoides]|nr:hypothetical protein NQZ68_026690 [Dissostichus eleginoides]
MEGNDRRFEGRRSTKRRLEREDCEDSPRKKDPLAKTAAEEILVSSEEEDGEKHPFISSAMAASQWCSAKKMGDKVIVPQILSMAPLDREAALHDLGEASNEEGWEDRMDPFMFKFKFESDYLMFFEQCIDKENLKMMLFVSLGYPYTPPIGRPAPPISDHAPENRSDAS